MYDDILDSFSDEMTTNAEVITNVSVYNEATGENSDTQSYGSSTACIFWEGSASKSLVSDSMRESVSAVAIFEPTVNITGEQMRINGKNIYSILGVDNIANQDAAQIVYLGEIT